MKLTEIFPKMIDKGIQRHLRVSSSWIPAFLLMGSLALFLLSCNTSSPQITPTGQNLPTSVAQSTASSTQTQTPISQRHGGWLDEIIFSAISKDSAITQLQAGTIDIYANGLASSDLPLIKANELKYVQYSGMHYSLMFNPAVFADSTKLNPFSNRKIREAMNWLVDRNYINQEFYAGGSLPKFFVIHTNGPDYADLADVARRLEIKYAYNFKMAKEVITQEMQSMGAVLENDKWSYKGQPVTLIFMIRPDGDGTRKLIGNYVASQLESIGFTVDIQYKNANEAAPIRLGDPTNGLWNLYTPGWVSIAISRDEKASFQTMYLDSSPFNSQPFLSNTSNDPEFKKVADDLANAEFPNLVARHEMMARALELSLQDSLQVWLIDTNTFVPYSQHLDATSDLVAGVESAQIWPYTLRFSDKEGGQLKWATYGLFGDPWNPVAGTNWDYDHGAIRATYSSGVMIDPYTGLVYPLRIEKAEVVAQEGLPIVKTLDWVDLKFEKEVKIPDDTLVDWDAEKQIFITAKQIAPKIADAKATVDAYKVKDADITPKLKAKAAELVKKVNLTSIDAATVQDIVVQLAAFMKELDGDAINAATIFSSGKDKTALDTLVATLTAPASADKPALKNEEKVAKITEFALSYVKVPAPDEVTMSLASRDYSHAKVKSIVYYPPDMFDKVKWHDGSKLSVADFLMGMIMTFDRPDPKSYIYDSSSVSNFLYAFISSFKGFRIISTQPLVIEYYSDTYSQDAELDVWSLWPSYGYGEGAWHQIAIANLAEKQGELAYSHEKADQQKIEQTSLIGGPSLSILAKYLDQAANEGYIPYAPTLGKYISVDEAKARYANLKRFAADHGHYWIGTGPYVLDKVFLTEKSLVLKNNPEYPDAADRWSGFGEPKIAKVTLKDLNQVKIGSEASFDVSITFKNQAYPSSEIKAVKYLLYNAKGELVVSGETTFVTEGQYKIVLPVEVTSKLEAGSNHIEVLVTTLPVSVPIFEGFDFPTVQ